MPSKGSKKDSAPASDPNHVYAAGDIVLAKLKGFPAWPGQVCEHGDAPPKVQKEKPPKGKNVNLVHAWLPSRDLSVLTPREIDSYVSSGNKKKGDLLSAYTVAGDPSEWRRERADRQAEYDALMEQQALAGDDEDQLASEGEGKKGEGKKRKRAPAGAANGADKKSKAKAGKKDDAGPAPKKAKTANADDPGETVKSWRHKLQKVFLGKGELAADEMPKCAEYFDAMEKFDMKKEWLTESKLAKVLKRIALMKDGQIPDEDKYSFRQRSSELANKWAALLGGSNDSPAPASAAKDDAPAPASNGDDAAPKADDAEVKADERAPAAADEEKKEDAKAEAADEDAKMDDAPAAANGDAAAADDKAEDAPAPAEDKKDDASAEAPAEASA
ncbi:hypothetical protein JCM10450v2_005105 [Rhodotorula kratochvilovae]